MLDLPYPPTVNHYWGIFKNRLYVKKEGLQFREATRAIALATVMQLGRGLGIDGDVAIRLEVWRPDKRKRDLDNLLKALLDALTHAGVWGDDTQVVKLTAEWAGHDPPAGRTRITIEPLEQMLF